MVRGEVVIGEQRLYSATTNRGRRKQGEDCREVSVLCVLLLSILCGTPSVVLHLHSLTFPPPLRREQGSTITYGSTITFQAFHGGILCFNSKVSYFFARVLAAFQLSY